ncbi:MAG: beta-ketoacyl-ACP synthase II [Verrucomicrobiota bacterium]|nr:beta-ketoacyl-ACP synthase II [Verrucomicrobiota bacterium]MDI9383931.1 beta-ketoacyl-ACP synthase II [Verrucomicrobiota bacterium]
MEVQQHRVVVTGIGVISALGEDLPTFWSNLTAGKSGIRPITRFDATDYTSRIAGEVVDFDPNRYMDPKLARKTARFTQMAVAASNMALQDAGLKIGENADPLRTGVFVGSGVGGIEVIEEQIITMHTRGPKRISPFFVPMMIANMGAGVVGIETGAKGPNLATVSACASGAHALGEAMNLLRCGRAEVMLSGGAEAAVSPSGIGGFCALRALSQRNDEPERASRPFDKDRDGFVMGEGAAMLVLETLEHALARGARIYAEFAGFGATCDAYHMTAPSDDGEGAARSMQIAMEDAGLGLDQIDYINAHGTATPLNDRCETAAIKRVFGDLAYKVAISSTKSMTGHLLGAAGAMEMAASVLAIHNGLVPPTINLETPDPDCDLDYVPNKARSMKVRAILNNALGFGGHNATLCATEFTA